jgi:hypothetical protein
MYYLPIFGLAVFIFVLFLLHGDVPHSFDAYISPFTGEYSLVSIVLLTIAVLDLIFINVIMIPIYLKTPKSYPAALVLTNMFGTFGLVIALLNENPWIALPFFAVSFGNFILVYLKISEMTKSM